MSNGDDETPRRVAHVKRVFLSTPGADGGDEQIDSDVWVDVLRIDKLPIVFQSKIIAADIAGVPGILQPPVQGQDVWPNEQQGQVISYYFTWNDDPNNPAESVDNSNADTQGENANSRRLTHQLKIKDPQNPDDDNQLKLWLVDKLPVVHQWDYYDRKSNQVIWLKFDNTPPDGGEDGDEPPADREVTVIKVVNNDLGDMKMADDDGSNPQLVDWVDYFTAWQAGINDDSQYLDVEITDRYKIVYQPDMEYEGRLNQVIQFVLAPNREVERLYELSSSDAVDTNGDPSVIRTDPLQCIVNVGFGGLAVEFGDSNQDAPER